MGLGVSDARAVKAKRAVADPGMKDLNLLSLRVAALDTLYEIDADVSQLHALAGLADGSTSTAAREARPTGKGKLGVVLKQLREAIVAAEPDDQAIAQLRSQVIDISSAEAKPLDDEVAPTETARSKSAAALGLLKAGQIAAYLASHADQVTDPAERLVTAVAEARELDAADVPGEIQSAAGEVGRLAAGDGTPSGGASSGGASSEEVAEKARQWLKNNIDATRLLKDDEFDSKRASLLESAGQAVGVAPPMRVLEHWMQEQMAILLSNPQAPEAIDDLLQARDGGQ
jgi:hypothetical protein